MSVVARLAQQRSRVAEACARVGRDPASVTLVAVSKGHPADAVLEAWRGGQRVFGESYVQEWVAKRDAVKAADADVAWHFIGHLQRNKVRDVVGAAALVHSVDRPALVDALDKRADAPLDVLLEVNVAGEVSKSGCAPDAVQSLLDQLGSCAHLRPVGLMTMAPYSDDAEDARPYFRQLRELRDRLRETLPEPAARAFRELSMGMSGDVEVAVEEGATIVRVGTAIFGPRRPR